MPKEEKSATLSLETRLKTLVEAMREEELVARVHHYSIWKTNNHQWKTTYIVDGKRKQVRRSTKEDIIHFLYEHYNLSSLTFGDVFNEWIERRRNLEQISESTYVRMKHSFNRFCTDISDRPLDKFEIIDYIGFMEEKIAEFHLSRKQFTHLSSIIKGTLNYAKRIHQTTFTGIDVMNEFKAISEVRFKKTYKTDSEEVFNEYETDLLLNELLNSDNIADIVLLLIFATGMRIGEAITLKHEDITEDTIHVCRTETSCRTVKDFPKTEAGIRTIVVPTNYQFLMKKLQRLNFGEEFIFKISDRDYITSLTVERRLHTLCDRVNIPRRSPHKIRKTYCSILLDAGVDESFIRQQVGHSSIVTTERYYHRNRKDIERKQQILDEISDFHIG